MLGADAHHRAGRPARTAAFVLCLLLSALVMPGPAYGGAIVKQAVRGHVVNGTPALLTSFGGIVPWQVGLVPVDAQGRYEIPFQVFCGGTIRDLRHIVTAAHCVPDLDADDLAVVNNLSDRRDPGAEVVGVAAITSHPAFRSAETGNDLAILTLSEALTSGQPVPIGEDGDTVSGAGAFISGWGARASQGPSPYELYVGEVEVLNDDDCEAYGVDFRRDTMLCAGTTGGVTVDACQGDSGGPLVTQSSEKLIGVVSWGQGCGEADFPGIYTKLANTELNKLANEPNPPPRAEPTSDATIQGASTVGQTLTCDSGQWTLPATFTFSWVSARLGPDNTPTDVRREGTAQTQALSAAHSGRIVGCTARATNEGGSRESSSTLVSVTAPAAAAAPPPVALPRDLVAPTSRFTRRACKRRRCTLTITASDSGGPAASATLTYQRITGCRRGRRGAKCRKAKKLKVRPRGQGVFTATTPRLKPATYRFTVVAVDTSGNRSQRTSVVLRVRR